MSRIFYKAVRPDGTDFYTRTVDYAALSLTDGKLPRLAGGECCTSGVYHAADTPSGTLVGGSWPCRLFAVTGKPVAQEEHKFGFRTLRVVGELEAWQALGPNGRDVAALIGQAMTLTEQQATALGAARLAVVMGDVLGVAPLQLSAFRVVAGEVSRRSGREAVGYAAWSAVAANPYAALDATAYAVEALVVRDLITTEQFGALYGPWASVIDADMPFTTQTP